MLIVLALGPTPPQPGERRSTTHRLGKRLNPCFLVWATHDLDPIPTVLGDPSVQRVVVVLVDRPQRLHAREGLFRELAEHPRRGRRIV